MKTPRIRCSSLPLAWNCPASQEPTDTPAIDSSDEAAEVGTAFHRWMAAHINGVELDQAALAAEHACDVEELRMLCGQGVKAYTALRRYFDGHNFRTEAPLSAELPDGTEIVGTGDVLACQAKTVIVLDWKTGRVDSDYTHQTRGYAYGAMREFDAHKPDSATVITVWVREGYWDVEHLTRSQVAAWGHEYAQRLKNGRGKFSPGAHCGHCPRATSCPGRREMVRSVLADLSIDGANVMEWTPETRAALGPKVGEVYGRLKVAAKAIDAFKDLLREDIAKFGAMPIGGGRKLDLTPVERRVIDPAKARPVLAKYLTPAEIDQATTISASEADELAVAKAEKGKGAATKRALRADLEAAGAISINTTHQLREGKADVSA